MMLSIYMLGAETTTMYRDFVSQGKLYLTYDFFTDAYSEGKTEDFINGEVRKFIMHEKEFVGDTRDGSFAIRDCEPAKSKNKLGEMFYYSLLSLTKKWDREHHNYGSMTIFDVWDARHECMDICTFDEIIGLDYFFKEHAMDILGVMGYKPIPAQLLESDSLGLDHGVILANGYFIPCGEQMHKYLYPKLFQLGLASSRDWGHCTKTIHVTYGQCSGPLGYGLGHRKHENLTQAQLVAAWKMSHSMTISEQGNDSIATGVLDIVRHRIPHGSKYAGLVFMRDIVGARIPKISLEKPEFDYCVRSSPKHSMAGLLDSYFGSDVEGAEEKMKAKWEQHKDHIYGNELHWFYQEELEGSNGVCHFGHDGFKYAMSAKRGAIVEGKTGEEELDVNSYIFLKEAAEYLYNRFHTTIQLEFVIAKDAELDILVPYIVQFRALTTKSYSQEEPMEGEVIMVGRSFKAGQVTLSKGECLIATHDLPSEALIGKRGLIVVNQDEFSHLLALSASLGIPSIQVDALPELPEFFSIDTVAKKGRILE